jgi:redoxin
MRGASQKICRGLRWLILLLPAGLLHGAGCGPISPSAVEISAIPLVGVDDSKVDARDWTSRAALTVFIFFSAHCHSLDAHDGRVRALFDAYRGRGVQFVMVDSETAGSLETDSAEAKRRAYPFPIVQDRGARLARALGAKYATYTVVADARGRIRYRGGLDSDRVHLHKDATFFLRDALDDLLADRAPRVPEAKTLGCTLATD